MGGDSPPVNMNKTEKFFKEIETGMMLVHHSIQQRFTFFYIHFFDRKYSYIYL